MTNAEKYLKDEVDLEEFSKSIMTWYFGNYAKANDFARIKNWAEHKIETLTEDERVILRNMIPQVKTIGRDTDGELIIKICSDTIAEDFCYSGAFIYDHLFQFVKNGEEYSIEELLKGE